MKLEHGIVYKEAGVYAAWPANHGGWQWDNELLFGFIRGKYGNAPMHNVVGDLEKVQARSINCGETWTVETGFDFSAARTEPAPPFSLKDGIIRACGVYDHGGEDCALCGGFYLSYDRGKNWSGAYSFDGIEFQNRIVNTSRTSVLGNLVFLSSNGKGCFGTDSVICARHDGKKFHVISEISDPRGRVVMPSVVDIGNAMVMTCRRRGGYRNSCWIDAYRSINGGLDWEFTSMVGDTGSHNGNPPALVEKDGRLICAFANRDDCGIFISISDDIGKNWGDRVPIRLGGVSDIGYPRLFNIGGTIVCVYYWAEQGSEQHIAWTRFDA